ncbi:MAG: carboxylating nicotinate-nucleotide diphosphorylase [Nitrospirae bacterium]|nr:carboxylating nicotinate-nucleotide diphosphorylase [Nitrospirota bacterium]
MPTAPIPLFHLQSLVRAAIQEDLSEGDITSAALIPDRFPAKALFIAQDPLTLAGLCVVQTLLQEIDPSLNMTTNFRDGQRIKASQTILTVRGPAQALLAAERIALNFLQHLSGIATMTAKYCETIRGYPAKILDTRKTTPGLRHLQKWAVRLGGGHNHRFSLGDGILIKDNHLSLLSKKKIGITQACQLAREHGPHHMRITVETESLAQVKEALKGQADIILLDNMKPVMVRKAVELIKGRAIVEVSGGVTLTNVRDMAAAGAQYISIGALTHSAPAVNIHMEFLRSSRSSL